MRKYGFFLIPLVFAFAAPAYAGDIALRIGKHAIQAEAADTPEAQKRGLMHRANLCADCGMLFVYSVPARYGFWMKNTALPLSIAFIGADGRITDIEDMQPGTLDVHYPHVRALYALEMHGGWFDAQGIKPGDRVEGLPSGAGPVGERN